MFNKTLRDYFQKTLKEKYYRKDILNHFNSLIILRKIISISIVVKGKRN